MRTPVLLSIKIYKKIISRSFLGKLILGDNCRFHPTCSDYTYEAISRYGTIRGLLMGVKRILRCHPYASGGYDPLK